MGRRAKQTRIPGTEPPSIPQLDEIGVELEEVRTKRMALTTEEVELNDKAVKLLHQNKMDYYRPVDCNFGLKLEVGKPGKDKVSIKRLKSKPEDGDDGTGEDSRAGKDTD